MKFHHSLTDGLGGMQVALLLFDAVAEPVSSGPMPAPPAGERLGAFTIVRQSAFWNASRAGRLLGGWSRGAWPMTLKAPRFAGPCRR
jgi:hypothetical protein